MLLWILNKKGDNGSMIKYSRVLLLVVIFYISSLYSDSKIPSFSYTAYNVSDLYSEALEFVHEKEYKKAIEKLEICQTTLRCASLLADIYKSDESTVRDINKSVHYQKILFGLGKTKAYHNIGLLYYKNGDMENAKKYFLMSSEAGVYESLFNLGKMYEKERSPSKALDAYKQASEYNIPQADYTLALYYYKQKDMNLTRFYFNKAADKGFEPAKKALRQLNRQF